MAGMAYSFQKPDHDHGHCVEEALSKAEALCQARGARLTPIRRRVLELLWQSHEPFGAYELLIEGRNAYVGCVQPDLPHAGQFLICKECGATAEMHSEAVDAALLSAAEALHFVVESQTIEITGPCPHCREGGV